MYTDTDTPQRMLPKHPACSSHSLRMYVSFLVLDQGMLRKVGGYVDQTKDGIQFAQKL
jgi:hypothetical protein